MTRLFDAAYFIIISVAAAGVLVFGSIVQIDPLSPSRGFPESISGMAVFKRGIIAQYELPSKQILSSPRP